MRTKSMVEPQVQVVTFRIGGSEFGLDVFSVHEIVRHEGVAPLPQAPPFVEGVVDVRGVLFPVVDLRRRFELPASGESEDARIVLAELGGRRLGLVVDQVTEVMRVPEPSISDPPDYVRGIGAEYIRGIARVDGRLIILIDMERVLSSEERIALEEVELEAPEA